MNVYYSISHASDVQWTMPYAHFHDNFEILLSLSGNCGAFIDESSYRLNKGTLVIVPKNVLHRNYSVESALFERYIIHFPQSTLNALSTSQTDFSNIFNQLSGCIDLDPQRCDDLIWLIENCLRQSTEDFGDDVRRNIFFMQLLLEICDIANSGKYSYQNQSIEFDKIVQITEYINNNARETLLLDDLAAKFSINKYYLCHLFKSSTGFTVIEYINSRRILHATELLKQGVSVQSAGHQAGFANTAYFIKNFKKYAGVTPGQYSRASKSNIR